MFRTMAHWTRLIALSACCLLYPPGVGQARAVDLEQAKGAIVSLQGDASEMRDVPGLTGGDPAAILRDLGIGAGRPGTPGFGPWPAGPAATTGVWVDDGTLLLSLLPPAMRRSGPLRAIGADGEPQTMTVLAWDPSSHLAVLGPQSAAGATEPGSDAPDDEAGNAERRNDDDRQRQPSAPAGSPLALAETAAAWGAPVRVLAAWQPNSPAVFSGIVATEMRYDPRVGGEAFQVDVVLPPQARGGPVVDQEGRIVGLIAARNAGGDASGPASAIGLQPIERLLTFVRDGGRGALPKPRLGVALNATPEGVLVGSALEGSPADEAGLAAGDRIVAIAGQQVQDPGQVIGAVNAHRPGDALEVTIERDGQRQQLTVTLGTAPQQEETINDASGIGRPALSPDNLPISPDELRQRLEQELGQPFGQQPPRDGPFPPQPPRIVAPGVPDALSEQLEELNEQLRQLRQQMRQQGGEPAGGEEGRD